ncbi:MAG: hypothetical protein J6B09_04715 [Clostridia bacterium]|nr:hypothetical protein [Clostridia bacterium]
MKYDAYTFQTAVPVWSTALREEMNISLSFRAEIQLDSEKELRLALAATSTYILRVNGKLAFYGPAAAARGFFRVDEIDLLPYLQKGHNIVTVRVAAYNTNSFMVPESKGFLCAEIVADGQVIAATGAKGFTAYRTVERVQRLHRYSYQRPFAECYDLKNGAFDYETASHTDACPISVERVESPSFVCRRAPHADFDRLYPTGLLSKGEFTRVQIDEEQYFHNRFLDRINQNVKGYTLDEMEYTAYRKLSELQTLSRNEETGDAGSIALGCNTYATLSFARNQTGIVCFELEAKGDGELYITFDELLSEEGEVNPFRLQTVNLLAFRVQKGSYTVVCAEPYTFKYMKLMAIDTALTVKGIHTVKVGYPESRITVDFVRDDAEMKRIFDAAVATFADNAFGIFADCPSRERAGWLCDSFFTSRAEFLLTGEALVERDFLENFILPDEHPGLPKGMLPMCYPSDILGGQFIPNWAMWYVLELEEYLKRSGDGTFVLDTKKKIYDLLRYFKRFENEYGLLEKLENWVFVEWSHANKLTQDVSFPSNMLYACMKEAIGRLYGDDTLLQEADALRETVRKMSFTGEFFCDNAYRRDGKLELSGEYTETCQYYAFFCRVAEPETYPQLWQTLLNDFGYERRTTGKYPDVHFANAFIGNQLRLDLLCRYGRYDILDRNIRDYYGYMAEKTGTLWEHENTSASCNHGFASHVLCWMKVLGYIK